MIISASRRTDIPSYYGDWFFNRIKEGFVNVRNPMNFKQTRAVSLTPEAVDGIVFWTKNPAPMLDRLNELRDYKYYFQFTLTPYGKDIEPNLPDKSEILETFKKLSGIAGPERVIWRYDPVLISAHYSTAFHFRAFDTYAKVLHNHTRKVIVSYIDTQYRGVKMNQRDLRLHTLTEEEKYELFGGLAEIARAYGLTMEACASEMELSLLGIHKARCIDSRLFNINIEKAKGQRPACGCSASADIGAYNTCLNGCRYCYANYNPAVIAANRAAHDPEAEGLY